MVKVCLKCGSVYETYNSSRKYCSPNCYHSSKKRKKFQKICESCGKTYLTTKRKQRYCSKQCRYNGHSKEMTREIQFYVNENGCHVCTYPKSKNKHGYISTTIRGKYIELHRKIYMETYGEIPSGYIVRHKCDNPACINPKHLELGTHTDNNRDKVLRGRQAKGERQGLSRLKTEQVIEIKNRLRDKNYISISSLAKEYGVSRGAINAIRRGDTWYWLGN